MSILTLHKSSIGKKSVVSITGFLLLGFVLAHMVGNLQIFLGPEPLNDYAEFLQGLGEILWAMRIGLLVTFVVHIVFAIQLAFENRAARPIGYQHQRVRQTSYASRLMVVTGILILVHVIYHLAHFTLGAVHSQYFHYEDALGRHDVYTMVVMSFRDPVIAWTYIVAMAFLAFHLRQAITAFPQSLGIIRPHTLQKFRKAGLLLAVLVFLGYASIPAAALAGFLKLPAAI